MRGLVHSVLGHPSLYNLSQRVLGASEARYRCLDELDARPGQRVLDVGCGPAYYLERLAPGVEYHGFDTDERYIGWATDRFGARARFYCDTYGERHLAELGHFDRVLLMGLLHHLDDREANALLALIARALAPGGRVVTLDTCYDDRLSSLERWLASQDRGRHVRETRAFDEMASRHFQNVRGNLIALRMPMRLWLMTMSERRG
ncbi:MAG TPA: methyltransferase domain-containing protein [Polyangiaceae bacterium]|jgi:SAM-dependent methyltransferase|nr:methyltransferase domain-containing protein [Polyangiaceae bacterium]